MRTFVLLLMSLFLLVLPVRWGLAQSSSPPPVEQFFPRQGSLLAGYGGAGYHMLFAEEDTPNNFSVVFAPIMLFQISDRFLFESEFEFEIEEGVTMTRPCLKNGF